MEAGGRAVLIVPRRRLLHVVVEVEDAQRHTLAVLAVAEQLGRVAPVARDGPLLEVEEEVPRAQLDDSNAAPDVELRRAKRWR